MSELVISGISKKYRSRHVIRSASLSVRGGEIVGLLGPNGAGKTTIFHMVTGLVRADSGSIFLDGTDISHLSMSMRARKGIGYLPQETSVFRKLTVEDNLMVPLEARGGLRRRERIARVNDLLDEFHLQDVRSSYGISLSGGEKRRVEIARAFAARPTFVLLDEPFAGIDPVSIIDMQKLARRLCHGGIGVLITDHNVRETLGICDRSYIVNQGAIIASGTPREVINNEKVREVYLGEGFYI